MLHAKVTQIHIKRYTTEIVCTSYMLIKGLELLHIPVTLK